MRRGPRDLGRRWRPRSVRARTALAAAAVAALVFGSGLWWMRQRLYDGQMDATRVQAEQQVDAILAATTANLRLGGDYGTLPYELVGGGGVVVSASHELASYETGGAPFMPDPGDGAAQPLYRRWTVTFPLRDGGGALSGRTLTAVDGTVPASFVNLGDSAERPGRLPPQARYRVYVFVTTTTADSAVARIDPFLIGGLPLAVALVALTAGFAVRRSLRPVEAIRARTALVTASDPRERVVVPRTGDELESLAVTINQTLQRLDDAAADQRRFIADAAHELRSPLTTLLAGLEVAQAYPDQADLPDTVDRAAGSTRRLQGLVDDLLLLARLDSGDRSGHRTVDLADVVEAVADDRPVDVEVAVVVLAPPDRALVRGDAQHLQRLLRNLLDNAARHALSEVRVTLDITQPQVVVLDVRDDGSGIGPDDRARVFERFTRLDDARARDSGGSGLGLAICRDIVVAHGGTIEIVDTAPPGTTVRVALPRADEPDPPR